jgi:hypothetical protein
MYPTPCSYWDGPAQEASDAAIRINRATDIAVEACNFVGGLGGYGVAVGNASTACSVSGCLFDGVGQGGVILYGFDAPSSPSSPSSPPLASVPTAYADVDSTSINRGGTVDPYAAYADVVAAGDNIQPTFVNVSYNTMTDIGQVHVIQPM